MKKYFFSLIGALFSMALVAQVQPLKPFKEGDKVVFAGNSITEAGFYEMYIWQYYILHFPQKRIQVINGGVGGDVAGQILTRLDDDILRKKPNVVVLTFGMNDSRYFEYLSKPQDEVRKEAVATSFESYKGIEKKLLALPNVQKILMASSPFDETVTGPKNNFPGKYKTMLEIAKFQEEAAKRNHWGFVDLMRPMTEVDQREQKLDTNFTLTGPDRIHPGSAGHFAMAYFFLKSQGLTGSIVADVTIDATTGKLKNAVNSIVTNVVSNPNKTTFNYTANSLPFPTDTVPRANGNPQKQADALKVIPFTNEMNKELLAVKGLKNSSNYALKIDGETIGSWNGSEFSKGINLAVLSNTPQNKRAQQIAELGLKYHDIEAKFRSYSWLQFNYFKKKDMMYLDSEAALDSVNEAAKKDWGVAFHNGNYKLVRTKEQRDGLEQQMKELANKMYSLSQPVKHMVAIELEK